MKLCTYLLAAKRGGYAALLPQLFEQRRLADARDAHHHQLQPRVRLRVLEHRAEVADHVGGLVGLDGGEGVEGLLQVAAVRVQVPQSVRETTRFGH